MEVDTTGPWIDVESVATPRSMLMTVQEGTVSLELVAEAKIRNFDHLPLVDSNGRFQGVVAVALLEELHTAGEGIHGGDPRLDRRTIPDRISLSALLSELSDSGVVAVEDSDGNRTVNWFALLTNADLNRHVFRGYLYPLFAMLESELARLIEIEMRLDQREDLEAFVRKIPKYNRATVLGRWELDKLDDVETGILAGCTLSDLLEIVKQTKALVAKLGVSGNRMEKISTALNDLRNEVMHPVKPIVRGKNGVEQLRSNLDDLLELTGRVRSVLTEIDAAGPVGPGSVP